jgi:hypothetical protein
MSTTKINKTKVQTSNSAPDQNITTQSGANVGTNVGADAGVKKTQTKTKVPRKTKVAETTEQPSSDIPKRKTKATKAQAAEASIEDQKDTKVHATLDKVPKRKTNTNNAKVTETDVNKKDVVSVKAPKKTVKANKAQVTETSTEQKLDANNNEIPCTPSMVAKNQIKTRKTAATKKKPSPEKAPKKSVKIRKSVPTQVIEKKDTNSDVEIQDDNDHDDDEDDDDEDDDDETIKISDKPAQKSEGLVERPIATTNMIHDLFTWLHLEDAIILHNNYYNGRFYHKCDKSNSNKSFDRTRIIYIDVAVCPWLIDDDAWPLLIESQGIKQCTCPLRQKYSEPNMSKFAFAV